MPNWTEQQLHVVGRKTDIDRFMRVGYERRRKGQTDNLLLFDALCTKPPGDADGAQIDNGVALTHWRTSTQACFDVITPWDYPAWFYESLMTEWPTLSFCCVVSGEMGDFGGLVMGLDGQFVNQVEDFIDGYNRRAHRRAANASVKRWMAFLTRDRDWRIIAHAPRDIGAMRADAHFDGNFWFYFRSREAMADFRVRYRCSHPERRVEGTWKRTR